MPTINQLSKEIFDNAVAHGFYEQYINTINLTDADITFIKQIWLSNRLMLIVSELGEALEGLRDSNMSIQPKSGGVGEELADACIRIFDLAYHTGINLEEAIRIKMEYNASRPYKHNRSL